jgi:hypothetical protein
MNFDVFISYSHQDKATADAACTALEAEGIRCWIAPRDVAPGADWAAAILNAIDRCRVMVLIFSSNANHSRQIHREVQQAFDREIPVVPLRVENVAPAQSLSYYMGTVHWLDALTPPLEAHLQQLADAVRRFLDAPGRGAGEPPPEAARRSEHRRQWSATRGLAPARTPALPWLFGVAGAGIAAAVIVAAWLLWPASAPVTRSTPSPPRETTAIEGRFQGTMVCDKLPWTAAPLHVAVSLSIRAGNATFWRDVYSGDGKRKTGVETGSGTLDADGVLQLKTSWVSQTARFDATYIGRMTPAGGSLAGKQILLVDGNRHERACSMTLQKVGDT